MSEFFFDEERRPRRRQRLTSIAITSKVGTKHYIGTKDRRGKVNPVNLTVGHTDTMGIAYFDQNGNPMLVTPTPDSPPAWANTPSADDTLVVNGPGNLTAVVTATASGTDNVTVTVVVGGKTFSASQPLNISPVPQVLTSVEITNSVV
jgi:hypothetical protein